MTLGYALLLAIFALVAIGSWVLWVSRLRAAAEAERAQSERDRMISNSQDIVHDVGNLLSAAFLNLGGMSRRIDGNPDEAKSSVGDVTAAIQGATELLHALRCSVEEHQTPLCATTEGYVRLHVAAFRSKAPLRLRVRGSLAYDGYRSGILESTDNPGAKVSRLVSNLLANAVRGAARAGGKVDVELTASSLRISNRVRDGSDLSDAIYELGKSGEGSTGRGLFMCKRLAAELGWSLSHEVRDEHVTFSLQSADIAQAGLTETVHVASFPSSDPPAIESRSKLAGP